jgi:hypothetical protein
VLVFEIVEVIVGFLVNGVMTKGVEVISFGVDKLVVVKVMFNVACSITEESVFEETGPPCSDGNNDVIIVHDTNGKMRINNVFFKTLSPSDNCVDSPAAEPVVPD